MADRLSTLITLLQRSESVKETLVPLMLCAKPKVYATFARNQFSAKPKYKNTKIILNKQGAFKPSSVYRIG